MQVLNICIIMQEVKQFKMPFGHNTLYIQGYKIRLIDSNNLFKVFYC